MKFTPVVASLVPVAAAWNLGLTRFGRPLVVYSPAETLLQQQRALMRNAFTQTSPRYEITDTDEKFQIAIDVPGLSSEDIHVSVEEDGRILSISGSKEKNEENYHYKS